MTGSSVDYTVGSNQNFFLQLFWISILGEGATKVSVLTASPTILPSGSLGIPRSMAAMATATYKLPSGICQTLPTHLNSPRASIRRLT